MTSQADSTNGAAAAPADISSPAFQIRAQYLRDVSFESPQGPLPLVGAKEQPNINVQVNVKHRMIAEVGSEVVLSLQTESKLADNTLFLVEVDYAAIVALTPDLDEEAQKEILLVEVPRLLFPYTRRVVADLVSEGGFPALLLNPVDFKTFAANAKVEAPEDAAPTIQ